MATLMGCAASTAVADDDEHEESSQRNGAIKGAQSAAAYPEAVLVDMLSSGEVAAVCSGALIAPRVVLTAGHCVRGESAWRVFSPSLGKSVLVDRAEAYDDYEDGEHVHPASHDIGLLRLTKPLHLPSYPALAKAPLSDGARVIDVGRIHDGQVSFSQVFASKPVRVHDASDIGFPHAYRATEKIESGDSGGPAFVAGVKPHVIAAVSSGGGGGVELLARVDLVRDWIVGWTGDDGDTAPDAVCKHEICDTGEPLDPECAPCVTTVCAADSFCCDTAWDDQCVDEASSLCDACVP